MSHTHNLRTTKNLSLINIHRWQAWSSPPPPPLVWACLGLFVEASRTRAPLSWSFSICSHINHSAAFWTKTRRIVTNCPLGLNGGRELNTSLDSPRLASTRLDSTRLDWTRTAELPLSFQLQLLLGCLNNSSLKLGHLMTLQVLIQHVMTGEPKLLLPWRRTSLKSRVRPALASNQNKMSLKILHRYEGLTEEMWGFMKNED